MADAPGHPTGGEGGALDVRVGGPSGTGESRPPKGGIQVDTTRSWLATTDGLVRRSAPAGPRPATDDPSGRLGTCLSSASPRARATRPAPASGSGVGRVPDLGGCSRCRAVTSGAGKTLAQCLVLGPLVCQEGGSELALRAVELPEKLRRLLWTLRAHVVGLLDCGRMTGIEVGLTQRLTVDFCRCQTMLCRG